MNVYAIFIVRPTVLLALCIFWSCTVKCESVIKPDTAKSHFKSSKILKLHSERGLTCVHCASPRSVLKNQKTLEAMDQLLELRGSSYPYDVVDPNCGRRANLSMIKTNETCRYPYCYSITFKDKESMPLLIRGCAETFLASKYLQDNQKPFCRRVHKELDISECVCRNGDVCSSAARLHKIPHSISTFSSLLSFISSSILIFYTL